MMSKNDVIFDFREFNCWTPWGLDAGGTPMKIFMLHVCLTRTIIINVLRENIWWT